MSQPEQVQDTHDIVTEFVLIQLNVSNKENTIEKAIGVYKTEEDAYAAALVNKMQSIEDNIILNKKWSIGDKQQEQLAELCRYIKEELSTYKERFEYMTSQCQSIFDNGLFFQINYQVVSLEINNTSSSISPSIFKTKIRNFLDAFQTKSDVEEDLGNSDDDEEEEEEEEEDEDGDGNDVSGDGDDDIEEEEEEDVDLEEEEEEDEPNTSETVLPESSDEEDLLEEEDGNSLKRNASAIEDDEDDEEDEIDEDNDEDELDDDDELSSAAKKRRFITSKD